AEIDRLFAGGGAAADGARQDVRPGRPVVGGLEIEARLANVAVEERDRRVGHGPARPEIEADPLAVAVGGPTGGEVVVDGVAGQIAVVRAGGHGGGPGRDLH